METKIQSKLATLGLVLPPISNQEALWLRNDAGFVSQAKQSDFYMIAGRAEAKFINITFLEETGRICFDFVIGDHFRDSVLIDTTELETTAKMDELWITAGEKAIKIWNGNPDVENSETVDWFTTETLLLERSQGRKGIKDFDKYREAGVYDLLYVGIAKVGDSYSRLIQKGHQARLEILANEPQRYPGARVTDETFLFLFSVNALDITVYEPSHEFQDKDFSGHDVVNGKRLVADAEKAFVNLLKPDYNKIKFDTYPKGTDGLYDAGYIRYGYVIRENLTFNTPHGKIVGSFDPQTGLIGKGGNMIFIDREKDEVVIT